MKVFLLALTGLMLILLFRTEYLPDPCRQGTQPVGYNRTGYSEPNGIEDYYTKVESDNPGASSPRDRM